MRHSVRRGSYFQVGVQPRLPSTWDVARKKRRCASGACLRADDGYSLPRRLLPLPVFTRFLHEKYVRITWLFASRQCALRTMFATAARIFGAPDARYLDIVLMQVYVCLLDIIRRDRLMNIAINPPLICKGIKFIDPIKPMIISTMGRVLKFKHVWNLIKRGNFFFNRTGEKAHSRPFQWNSAFHSKQVAEDRLCNIKGSRRKVEFSSLKFTFPFFVAFVDEESILTTENFATQFVLFQIIFPAGP